MNPQTQGHSSAGGGGTLARGTSLLPTAATDTKNLHSKPQPRQIHRNRISYSCHSCRRRKIKCDKAHPTCGHCRKLEVDCEYNESVPAKVGQRENSSSSSDSSTSPPVEPEPTRAVKNKRARVSAGSSSESDEIQYYTPQTLHSNWPHQYFWERNSNLENNKDLEHRSFLLAECLDQWYKSHHLDGLKSHSKGHVELQSESLAQLKLQLRWIMQPQSQLLAADLMNFAIKPNNETGPLFYLATPEIIEMSQRLFNRNPKLSESLDLNLGRLDIQEQGITRYTSGGFWDLDEDQESKTLDDQSSSLPSPHEAPVWKRLQELRKAQSDNLPSIYPDQSVKSLDTATACSVKMEGELILLSSAPNRFFELQQIMTRSFPTKAQSDILYKAYLRGVHPIVPLFHAPTFDRQYKMFWSKAEAREAHTSYSNSACSQMTPFVSLIGAVLYAGCTSMSSELVCELFDVTNKSVILKQLLEGLDAALEFFQFPKAPATDSLTAFLIKHTCLTRAQDALTTSNAISTAMRVAQSMGMHRDGKQYGLSELESEKRRRIWWHILHLDVQSSIATGLPPLGGGNEDLYDTAMVSELKDEYIGVFDDSTATGKEEMHCKEGLPCSPDSAKVSVSMLLAIGRYERARVLYRILHRLSGVKELLQEELTQLTFSVSNLKFKIDELRGRIQTDEASPAFNHYANLMLGTYCDEAFVLLTKPFMRSTKKAIWQVTRLCVMKPAHCFAESLISLSTTPSFQPFHWYSPGTLQPLHISMALLLDLHLNPTAPDSDLTYHYATQIFKCFVDDFKEDGNDLDRISGDIKEWEQLRKFMIKRCNQECAQAENIPVQRSTSGSSYGDTPPAEISHARPPDIGHSYCQVVCPPPNDIPSVPLESTLQQSDPITSWPTTNNIPISVSTIPDGVLEANYQYEASHISNKPTHSDYYYANNHTPITLSSDSQQPATYVQYNNGDSTIPEHGLSEDQIIPDFNWNEWDLVFDNVAPLSTDFTGSSMIH